MQHNGKFVLDLYSKPADQHCHLQFSSNHSPECIKKSSPHSQLLRIKHICTPNTNFKKHVKITMAHFRKRGYTEHVLQKSYDKALLKDRKTLLSPSMTADTPAQILTRELYLLKRQSTSFGQCSVKHYQNSLMTSLCLHTK